MRREGTQDELLCQLSWLERGGANLDRVQEGYQYCRKTSLVGHVELEIPGKYPGGQARRQWIEDYWTHETELDWEELFRNHHFIEGRETSDSRINNQKFITHDDLAECYCQHPSSIVLCQLRDGMVSVISGCCFVFISLYLPPNNYMEGLIPPWHRWT